MLHEGDLARDMQPPRHLRPVEPNDHITVQAAEIGPVLSREQRAFRAALTARIRSGEPLAADEMLFLRNVAAQLYGIQL